MKGFALVLLCVVAVVQGRSTAVQSSGRSLAALGDNPWLVHLRQAIGTSGFLESCAGTLIDNRWVLTAGSCVQDARFVWIRYGVVTVINPELVTESSTVRLHPQYSAATNQHNIGLVSVNRYVQSTANIRPVAVWSSQHYAPSESVNFCGFGENESGDGPGGHLGCFEVGLDLNPETAWAYSDDGQATRFDLGAPLVHNSEVFGILITPGGQPTEHSDSGAGIFLQVGAYRDWIAGETGLAL